MSDRAFLFWVIRPEHSLDASNQNGFGTRPLDQWLIMRMHKGGLVLKCKMAAIPSIDKSAAVSRINPIIKMTRLIAVKIELIKIWKTSSSKLDSSVIYFSFIGRSNSRHTWIQTSCCKVCQSKWRYSKKNSLRILVVCYLSKSFHLVRLFCIKHIFTHQEYQTGKVHIKQDTLSRLSLSNFASPIVYVAWLQRARDLVKRDSKAWHRRAWPRIIVLLFQPKTTQPYEARYKKDQFKDPRIRVRTIYDYKSTYGVVLAGNSTKRLQCSKSYMQSHRAEMYQHIAKFIHSIEVIEKYSDMRIFVVLGMHSMCFK